jgi:hypothetical protein
VGLTAAQQLHADFHDHPTFARECLRIRDKQARTVPFANPTLQPAQIKLNELIQKQRAARKPVRIIVLKARQVMISAGTAAQFFHKVPFNPGNRALIVAHEAKASKNIFGYYKQLHDNYTPFRGVIHLPELDRDAAGAGVLTYIGGSAIEVSTANNVKTGRSASLRYLHLSEYAFWRDARTLMTGLMQTVPDDPETMVIIESTANGVGGDFYLRWKEACDPTAETDWVPLFFAWWEHPAYQKAIEDRAEFQKSLTREEIELRQKYTLTLEQLNWRRWCLRNNCNGSVDQFKQEYPACPEEAFLFSGRPRFSHVHLAKMPVKHDGLVGELIEDSYGPKTVLQFNVNEDRRGALVVFKKPQENRRYTIGVDVAEGIDNTETGEDPDYSVAIVADADTGEQVAKLRGRIEPGPFGEYVAALGRYYNWAYLVPEANGPGIALIERLMQEQYPPGLLYRRRVQPDERFETGQDLQTIGWKNTTVTRPQLLSKLDMAIRELSLIFVDPNTVDELKAFVWKPNGKCEAQEGSHDDEVFAAGLCVVGIETMPADDRLLKTRGTLHKAGSVKQYGKRRLDNERERGQLVRY